MHLVMVYNERSRHSFRFGGWGSSILNDLGCGRNLEIQAGYHERGKRYPLELSVKHDPSALACSEMMKRRQASIWSRYA